MSDLIPIPIPAAQRWREFRYRAMPALVFAGAALGATLLWRQQIPSTALVGEVEPLTAHVSSPKAGVLANFHLTRLQRVKADEAIAQVITTDPRVLQSSLAVILAEIKLLRVNLEPILGEQRYAIDYDRLRLDWMEQRVQLATVRTKLQLAESEFRRTDELYRDKVVSEKLYEEARIGKERLEAEVEERSRLISEQEKNLGVLPFRDFSNGATNALSSAQAIMQASINVQEEKLRLTEAELSPVVLRIPMDGVVTSVLRHSGEAVRAGELILTLSAGSSEQIVGYIRQPMTAEPKVGMSVEVAARSFKREIGQGKILQVGVQMEPIKSHLRPSSGSEVIELGLPILVSIPPNLKLLPGEIVDLHLRQSVVSPGAVPSQP